jgi:arylsulfatase A-like enzyme
MRNLVLLIVDSLRARSLSGRDGASPSTPFLDGLLERCVTFRRAYATECWTLPSHMSMFTGLLPSEHRAHFQRMAYEQPAPTLAELAAQAGYHTEVITRNSLFDGTVPGATRGFAVNTRVLAEPGRGLNGLGIVLALAKPRLRRLMRQSGFFHVLQRQHRDFLSTLVRMGMPADRPLLAHALERMATWRREGRRYFLFLNLYDVHAPYSPTETSPLRPFRSWQGWYENLQLPFVLPRVSGHAYLRPGFRMSERGRRMLVGRYHRAIELMDDKLASFYDEARRLGLLDDTLLVVASDHGEAFGEHRLYFHDASVYDTHLHVPLWIHHPDHPPTSVDDVVSTQALFALLRAEALGLGWKGTLLDADHRAAHPVALAEHFHYPHVRGLLPQFRQNVAAARVGPYKMIARREGTVLYDLARDRDEVHGEQAPVAELERLARRHGVPYAAVRLACDHLLRWGATSMAA